MSTRKRTPSGWSPRTSPRTRHDWCCAIARTELDASAKLIAFVLTEWADWETGADVYPSVGTIAQRASRSARTVSSTIDRLARLGVLSFVRRSKGHGTHRMKLNWDGLVALCSSVNPQDSSELNPEDSSESLPRNRGVTPQKQPGNGEDSCEEHITPTGIKHTTQQADRCAVVGGGLQPVSSQTPDQLRRIGVSAAVAQKLTNEHPDALIAAVVAECELQRPAPNNPAGWIVATLRDPDRIEALDAKAEAFTQAQAIATELAALPDEAIVDAHADWRGDRSPPNAATLRERYARPSNLTYARELIDRAGELAP